MGKPIQKKWFGSPIQISVNGVKFSDGATFTEAYIIKQTGSAAYMVQDNNMTHAPEKVFLANASDVNFLSPGQCFILATPFNGSPFPCAKITQFRVDLYEANGAMGSYSWSTIPAINIGQADLVIDNSTVQFLVDQNSNQLTTEAGSILTT